MNPLVTIGIPTYNRADGFLPSVITAALAQTWPHLEVLVGDNASSDATPDVVNAFDNPRLRYIRHETNIGGNQNFNYLLGEAKGEWFLLLHDDDLIDSDFIESCMSIVEPDHSLGFIRTGVRAIDNDGQVLRERTNMSAGLCREDFYKSWFQYRTGFYLCNTLYHTERLRQIDGFHSLHNLLDDNFALVKLLDDWDHGDIEAVKASYRYSYDQRTFRVPVSEWCQDFQMLLGMILNQCRPERREEIEKIGNRFFGRLSVRRANVIAALWKRVVARMNVARYFGWRTLRQRWT